MFQIINYIEEGGDEKTNLCNFEKQYFGQDLWCWLKRNYTQILYTINNIFSYKCMGYNSKSLCILVLTNKYVLANSMRI